MQVLKRKLTQVESAKKAAKDEILKLFPIGSDVRFTIMYEQRRPSTGVVVCAGEPGYLRVKHNEAKPYSRNAYRDVYYTNIVE